MAFSLFGLHYTAILPAAALALVAYSAIASLALGRRVERILKLGLVLAAVGWLVYWIPFIRLDFTLHEVFWNTSPGLPLWMRLASAWAGGGGSLYLFSVVASLAGLYLLRRHEVRWLAGGVAVVVTVGLLAAFLNDAFTVLPEPPASGAGLNPLLKSPWLYPHPLTTFGGYALLAVSSIAFLAGVRREGYILYEVGWALLTLGILIGGYWSYETFGWGGYWAWDPVETSELMVWLVATLLAHMLAVAPSLSGFNAAWLLSSIFTAMYVTRSGLSPLHSFAASTIGAASLLSLGAAAFAYAVWRLYTSVELAGKELSRAIRSLDTYRVGLAVAFAALLAASVFVYASLFIPALYTLAGHEVTVPQMKEGVEFYHPVLYPLLIAMLAAIPAVFTGKWLGWRGYAALTATTAVIASVLAVAAYRGYIVLAPLSPQETSILMAFGLPWAVTAAASTATYIALQVRRRSPTLLGDRLSGLSLLHLGLSLTVLGILLSGTYAFNTVYLRDYTLKPGEVLELPGGVKLVFEDYSYGISSSRVDIYTQYVGRSSSYYYGQVALYTLANDMASIIRDYEVGRSLYENRTLRLLLNLTMRDELVYLGNFTVEANATVRFISFTQNATMVIAYNEPVRIMLTNVTLTPAPVLDEETGRLMVYLRLSAARMVLELQRNVSAFMPPLLGVHELLALEFNEPTRIVLGNITVEVVNATLTSQAMLSAGKGAPLRVEDGRITGEDSVIGIDAGRLVVWGNTSIAIPAELPRPLVVYAVVSQDERYRELMRLLNETGLYELLREPDRVLELAFTRDCLASGALFADSCRAYVAAPRLVPETAWLDVKLLVGRGDDLREVKLRIRFEAYGEVQGIHGLVPKVMHPGLGLDELYIVINPPVVDSIIYGKAVAYHELLIYYLHEAFKNLTVPDRLALAAVMVGGYNADFVSGLEKQQARAFLENSLLDVYILASKFDPANSTLVRDGLRLQVKLVPGVRLVWIGPVVMAVSALYLAAVGVLASRRAGRA
ncbi:cytochrome c biogenesis protein CcsA [Hyperthermus butylicus]|uniref:Cytochrome c assembly protein domain-containing protein n=1 Tax=Hyperthermus butylicus (strain DSM 5456 / JCM 9403 / PLM1-5) TaxID=415426 RepID=A2BMX5_HYPBU|nr:cytochrome c biogenesis protein CcsA [Hyperthermus butylicus]ABM81336.1 hypothetical protein Hbut_1514 [Hyperthermus butylicus DSM 5456]